MNQENQLVIIVKESGLEQTKANYILEQFKDYFDLASEWEVKAKSIVITDESQITEMKMAREARLMLSKKRFAIENARKELKEQSIREGRAIDGVANILKGLIVPIEEYLEKQEKYAENKQAEREELKRIEADRLLAEQERKEAERIEAERIAKEKATEEERKRLQEENRKLQEEADRKEKERQAELAKIELERQKERDEQEKIRLAEIKKQAEVLRKQQEEADRKLEEERLRAEKEAKELRAKLEAKEKTIKYTAQQIRTAIKNWYDPKDLDDFMENGLPTNPTT